MKRIVDNRGRISYQPEATPTPQAQAGDDPRSTHHVHRGPESLPCYCDATMDHAIGQEGRIAEARATLAAHDANPRLETRDAAISAAFTIARSLPQAPARDAGAVAWGVVYDGKVRMASTSRKRAEEMEGDEPRDGSDIEHAYIVPLFTHPAAASDDARDAARYHYLRDATHALPGAPIAVREDSGRLVIGTELDAAIDAAIGGTK